VNADPTPPSPWSDEMFARCLSALRFSPESVEDREPELAAAMRELSREDREAEEFCRGEAAALQHSIELASATEPEGGQP
jgi:hypothetical protein